jgi:hypothetical protein
MTTVHRFFLAATVAVVLTAASAAPAHAQFVRSTVVYTYSPPVVVTPYAATYVSPYATTYASPYIAPYAYTTPAVVGYRVSSYYAPTIVMPYSAYRVDYVAPRRAYTYSYYGVTPYYVYP